MFNVKGSLGYVVEQLLKTPAIAEELRRSLVNRDIAITIDDQTFQLTKKRADEEEISKLKARLYDHREFLKSWLGYTHSMPMADPKLNSYMRKAKELLED